MPETDVARLKRVAYARASSDDERMLALAALEQLAVDAEVAHRAAAAEAQADAARRVGRTAARLQRLRILRTAALATAAAVLIGFGVTAYATSGGGGRATSLGAASASATPSDGAGASASAGSGESSSYGIGAAANPGDIAGAATGSAGSAGTAGTGPVSTEGSSTTYSNATHSVTNAAAGSGTPGSTSERFGSDGSSATPLGGTAAMSPAVIFTVAQTAADHPAGAIPGDTVESSYRLLSRGQYTPGSAYAALSSDGRICLVVFGGGADFGETCQSVLLTLSNGLQAGVTSATKLNPRSGSQLVTVVHFAATWNTDGTFLLAVTVPGASQPAG